MFYKTYSCIIPQFAAYMTFIKAANSQEIFNLISTQMIHAHLLDFSNTVQYFHKVLIRFLIKGMFKKIKIFFFRLFENIITSTKVAKLNKYSSET